MTLSLSAASIAAAGEQYVFPSAAGVQLSASPPPTFVSPASSTSVSSLNVSHAFVSGYAARSSYDPPLPPPNYAFGRSAPYAGALMSRALMVAPYANYAADYARLFAPNYAITQWTERVFGIVDGGYTPVDGWTAATYGMPRLQGPHRRSESAPDLSAMPKFRPHPELEAGPTFKNY